MQRPALLRTLKVGSTRSEEHTSELQSLRHLVCRLLLEKKYMYLATPCLMQVLSSASAVFCHPLRTTAAPTSLPISAAAKAATQTYSTAVCFFFNATATPGFSPLPLRAVFPF